MNITWINENFRLIGWKAAMEYLQRGDYTDLSAEEEKIYIEVCEKITQAQEDEDILKEWDECEEDEY